MDDAQQKATDLITKYTENKEYANPKGSKIVLFLTFDWILLGMTEESFFRYLLSSDNLIFDPQTIDLYMDMNKPLSHYFISSSHNTYLAGLIRLNWPNTRANLLFN